MKTNFMKNTALLFGLMTLFAVNSNANELTLHMVRAPHTVNWNSVNGLLISSAYNTLGKAPKSNFALGHWVVEINCDTPNELGVSHVMTGMTQKNMEESRRIVKTAGLGLGSMVYPFEGILNASVEMQEAMKVMTEHNRYKSIVIPTTAKRCQRMLSFMSAWIANGSYTVYGGGQDVANGEGSGCAEFAEQFFEIATDKKFPESWVMEKKIPMKLIGTPENRVSLLKLILRKKWAKADEDFLMYRMPDITTAMNLMDEGFDISTLAGNSMIDTDEAYAPFEFKFNYNVSVEDQKAMWNRIMLPASSK